MGQKGRNSGYLSKGSCSYSRLSLSVGNLKGKIIEELTTEGSWMLPDHPAASRDYLL